MSEGIVGPGGKPLGAEMKILDAQGNPAGEEKKLTGPGGEALGINQLLREEIARAANDPRVQEVIELLLATWGAYAFLREILLRGSKYSDQALTMLIQENIAAASEYEVDGIGITDLVKSKVVPALETAVAPFKEAVSKGKKQLQKTLKKRRQGDLSIPGFSLSVPRSTLFALEVNNHEDAWQVACLFVHHLLCNGVIATYMSAEQGRNYEEARALCGNRAVPLVQWFNVFGDDRKKIDGISDWAELLVACPYGFLYPRGEDKQWLPKVADAVRSRRVPLVLVGHDVSAKLQEAEVEHILFKGRIETGRAFLTHGDEEIELLVNTTTKQEEEQPEDSSEQPEDSSEQPDEAPAPKDAAVSKD